MGSKIIDGRNIAQEIKEDLKQELKILRENLNKVPKLIAIQVGDNPGVEIYSKSQQKIARELGIDYEKKKFESTITQDLVEKEIKKLNVDSDVSGIILLQPLPENLNFQKLIFQISPAKDVEGIHPFNLGKILVSDSDIIPCTAGAVVTILDMIIKNYTGKEVVIIGHSSIVGKPLALILMDRLATVRVCHIGTSLAGNLEKHVRTAEVLIVAVGKAGLIKGEWIKEGAIVVDVGINRKGGKIVGDVEFEKAVEKAAFITPVPGGVGPITNVMLMQNLLRTFKSGNSF